jgi:3-carboxy-cis,cis-muconate cycloisomerase
VSAAGQPSSLFSTPEMDRVFSLLRQLQHMTRFEWALNAALEASGLAAKGAAEAVEPLLDAAFVDIPSLHAQEHQAGNVAIPFIRQLTAAVRLRDEKAARSLHLGATSQDVLDTALVLQMREALQLIRNDLQELDRRLVQLIDENADAILAGRTWLQEGPPVTLGLKMAGWLSALRRHQERLESASQRAIVIQFGGAVGTLAALGERGPDVAEALAQKLGLPEPDLPWHTQRDNIGEVGATLGLLTGTLGKIARDISLLMQTEVAEIFEPGGEDRGGSSTMPHKRNPVGSAVILAAAARVPGLVSTLLSAMLQEHERGLGGWHAEWEALPAIFRLTSVALSRTLEITSGLEVHREKMLANIEATRGLAMSEAVSVALAAHVGRARAHELLEEASRRVLAEQIHLRDVLAAMPEVRQHLSETDVKHLLDPSNYLGSTRRFIKRVLNNQAYGEPDASR